MAGPGSSQLCDRNESEPEQVSVLGSCSPRQRPSYGYCKNLSTEQNSLLFVPKTIAFFRTVVYFNISPQGCHQDKFIALCTKK